MERIIKELSMSEWAKVIKEAHTDNEMLELVPEKIIYQYMDDCTKHIIGPKSIETTENDCLVLVILKNGESYVQQFMEYYEKIGIKHFFFLDNGSTDRTIELLKEYNNVSVFQTELTYRKFWNLFKRFLLEKFGVNSWNLVVDIDEFFDYPFSNDVKLPKLLNYLNQNNYQAVVTQMLDMFPEKGIIETSKQDENFLQTHNYYDNDQLDKREYHEVVPSNSISNTEIKFHSGGVRKRIFGLDTLFLTKHVLIKFNTPIVFHHDHYPINARVADLSTVLYHYKFHGDFATYVDKAVESGVHWNNSFQYRKYQEVLNKYGDINFYEETSKRLTNTDQLIDDGFLTVSSNYVKYAENIDKLILTDENNIENAEIDRDSILLEKFAELFDQQDRKYRYLKKKILGDISDSKNEFFHKEISLNKKLKYNRDELAVAKDQLFHTSKENEEIKKSFSFKLGYGLTRIPNFLFGWLSINKKK